MKYTVPHAVFWAVTRRPVIVETWVPYHVSPRRILSGQRGIGTGFFSQNFGFLLSVNNLQCSIEIFRSSTAEAV